MVLYECSTPLPCSPCPPAQRAHALAQDQYRRLPAWPKLCRSAERRTTRHAYSTTRRKSRSAPLAKVAHCGEVSCQLLPRAKDCEYLRVLPTVVLTRGAFSVYAMRMYATCVQSMSPCMLYISRCQSSCCVRRSLPKTSRSRPAYVRSIPSLSPMPPCQWGSAS